MINIFKNTKQELQNRYLDKRYEQYLKINKKHQDKYNSIRYMGIDGSWHSNDYNETDSNNINAFISLMPTKENIEKHFSNGAELPRNFETSNDYCEIELDLSGFDEKDRDNVRDIILNNIAKPNFDYWPNHQERGIRPIIDVKENKILAFNRSLNIGQKSFNKHVDFSSPEFRKAQCEQINKALAKAGYDYKVKGSVMDDKEPTNNNSELSQIEKENKSLREEINKMKKDYKELATSAEKLFDAPNQHTNIAERVIKKKEERNYRNTLTN